MRIDASMGRSMTVLSELGTIDCADQDGSGVSWHDLDDGVKPLCFI